MLELVIRPRAERDLDAIADYSEAAHGQVVAKRYLQRLARELDFAREFPGAGSRATGLPDGYRKLRCGMHRIIYRYSDSELIVVRVLHQREDVPDEWDDLG